MLLPASRARRCSVAGGPFRIAVTTALLSLTPVLPLSAQQHPLDPPTWQEHWTVLEVLRAARRLDDSTTFSLVLLHPPNKAATWAWRPGQPVPRSLQVVTRRGTVTSEAVVDVAARRLVSWRDVPGAQAPWLGREFEAMERTVKEHSGFIAAMKRRGIDDLFFVSCGGGPPGTYGQPEEEGGRRIAHVHCRDVRQVRNGWTRGIEGLTVVFDMDAGEVIRVVDEQVVPVPSTIADYDAGSIGAPHANATPIRLDQPNGPGFTLDGHQVSWLSWRFHVRPDHRVGPVLSLVRWMDDELKRERQIMYEGFMSEIFVPYMDPSIGWYPRNFLDAGEYTVGGLLKPLQRGIDCPANSVYLSQVIAGDDGHPRDIPDVICIFERYASEVSWRHLAHTFDGRPKRDLVVRSAAVLGNYDYIFDWAFQQDGTIRVAVGATGIAEAKPVVPKDALLAAATAGTSAGARQGARADAYGRYVDEHIVAVNHDHYFSFRLDLDVDGPVNTFMKDALRTVRLPEEHPRRSLWVVDGAPLRTESEAKLNMDMHHPSLWRVISPSARNRNGYATSYQLSPGMVVETLLSEDDWPRRRAGFIDHHIWVTPYRADERYAAGMYPTLSQPGEGLPKWTAANRAIHETDIVVWYTTGMHHIVRAEDWPVMPVAWITFELRPFDFFGRNPAMRAPMTP